MESPLDHLPLPGQAGELQILPDQGGRVLPLVHESAPGRPPGQGFDTQLASTGEQVQNVPAGYLKLYDIEQGLFHPVGGGAGLHPLQSIQPPPAGGTGNHTHI